MKKTIYIILLFIAINIVSIIIWKGRLMVTYATGLAYIRYVAVDYWQRDVIFSEDCSEQFEYRRLGNTCRNNPHILLLYYIIYLECENNCSTEFLRSKVTSSDLVRVIGLGGDKYAFIFTSI